MGKFVCLIKALPKNAIGEEERKKRVRWVAKKMRVRWVAKTERIHAGYRL